MSDLLERTDIDVATLPDGVDLVALIRTKNESGEWDQPSWTLVDDGSLPLGEACQLMFGVNGDSGALWWGARSGNLIPADGVTRSDLDYWLAGMYSTPFPPGSELPVERVYTVLGEFLMTRRLLTCIQWRPASEGA